MPPASQSTKHHCTSDGLTVQPRSDGAACNIAAGGPCTLPQNYNIPDPRIPKPAQGDAVQGQLTPLKPTAAAAAAASQQPWVPLHSLDCMLCRCTGWPASCAAMHICESSASLPPDPALLHKPCPIRTCCSHSQVCQPPKTQKPVNNQANTTGKSHHECHSKLQYAHNLLT